MSVQISYKKQALFGFLLILCILSITEVSMRVYDFYFPNCQFIESEVYDEISFELKREICSDNEKLVIWYDHVVHWTSLERVYDFQIILFLKVI